MASAGKKLRDIMRKKTGSNPAAPSATDASPGCPQSIVEHAELADFPDLPTGYLSRKHPLLKSASVSSFGGHSVSRHLSSMYGEGSLRSLHVEPSVDDGSQQQQQHQSLSLGFTDEVKRFMDVAFGLRGSLCHCCSSAGGRDFVIVAREKLGQLLLTLRHVMAEYPLLHPEEILDTANSLIAHIKGMSDHSKDESSRASDSQRILDKLVAVFSRSAMSLIQANIQAPTAAAEDGDGDEEGGTESYESSARTTEEGCSSQATEASAGIMHSYSEMDARLLKLETAVDHALARAKIWSKYTKNIVAYVEKRNAIEAEFCKSLSKLAQASQPGVTESTFVPFQRAFSMAVEQDLEYSNISHAACNIILLQKFVEPLSQCRVEHDRQRKSIKETWLKCAKRENDAVINMKKSKVLYEQRWHEYEKVKDSSTRGMGGGAASSTSLTAIPDILGSSSSAVAQKNLEKKRKTEEDAYHKTVEAEVTYKSCVAEANGRHQELIRTKEMVLQQVRDLLTVGDRKMKAATAAYFQLRQAVTMALPEQFQLLHDLCCAYAPGAQYEEFVCHLLSQQGVDHADVCREPYAFEPYRPDTLRTHKGSTSASSVLSSNESRTSLAADDVGLTKIALHSVGSEESDTDSCSSTEKSLGSSPLTSPHLWLKSDEVSTQYTANAGDPAKLKPSFSGHNLRKLRTPSRCRLCDSYVYFGGEECAKCGLVCHRKCLRSSSSQCVVQVAPPSRRMTTFGVDVSEHVSAYNVAVPLLVTRCIQEVDRRGIETKGIYRLSGVKSKVEKLCQSFENGKAADVDLSQHNPVVISNVLKLYLRQLPEPLLTTKLYHEFIGAIKEQHASNLNEEQTLPKVLEVLQKLPKANYATLQALATHLRRVAQLSAENQMNANNLGIVFGPTLLQPSTYDVDDTAPLTALMDASHQARVVELLIRRAPEIFNYDESQIVHPAPDSPAALPRDRCSLSSEGAESSNSCPENVLGDIAIMSLPEIDYLDVNTSTDKDCNGNEFNPGASSSDALSDVCISLDKLSASDEDYCGLSETQSLSGVTEHLTLPPRPWPLIRSDSSPGVVQQVLGSGDRDGDNLDILATLGVADSTDGSAQRVLSASSLEASIWYERPGIGLRQQPVPPPRMRRSVARKASLTSPVSDCPPPARYSLDVSSPLSPDASPTSALSTQAVSLHASSESLVRAGLAFGAPETLAPILRSKSMSRMVFYSDIESVKDGANPGRGDNARKTWHVPEEASRPRHARSMKRMSDVPHFV